MKRKKYGPLIIFLLIVCDIGLNAQDLYVREKDGTQTAYALTDVKKISFQARIVEVDKTDGASDSYTMEAIRYLNFVDLTNSGPIWVETAQDQDAHLFPNPVKDLATIQIPCTGENHIVTVYTAEGKIVLQNHFRGYGEIHIDLSSLAGGIYFCRVTEGKSSSVVKFLKY